MGVHREAELVLGLDQAHALAAHVKKGFQHQSEAKLNSSFSHDKTGVDKAKSSTSPNSRAAVDYRWSGSFRERPRASDSQKEFQETIRRLGHVEVRPVDVVEVADLPLLPSYLVSEGERSTNVVASVLFTVEPHLEVDPVPVLAKEQCVSHLLWPVHGNTCSSSDCCSTPRRWSTTRQTAPPSTPVSASLKKSSSSCCKRPPAPKALWASGLQGL